MGVSKKKKRKIMANDRLFYWYVKEGDDDDRLYLNIISDDKRFNVSYMLDQKNTERIFSPLNPYIIVIGKEFKGLNNLGHGWERFLVPGWDDETITPALVKQIINWSLLPEKVTPVNYKGDILSMRPSDLRKALETGSI